MNCINPLLINNNGKDLYVPCGKCLNCRIQKRTEWTVRLLFELTTWDVSCFATLTYDDRYLPENGSIVKSDLVKYFKRLRRDLNGDEKLKYFGVGEYGEESGRPHYHAIVFGINDKRIEDNWTYGFVHKGYVSHDSIQYVCKYIFKKFTGKMEDKEYKSKGKENVFRIMSKGIGRDAFESYIDSGWKKEYLTVNGLRRAYPKYFWDRLDEAMKDNIKSLAEQREMELQGFLKSALYRNDPDKWEFITRKDHSKNKQIEKTMQKKIDLNNKLKKKSGV